MARPDASTARAFGRVPVERRALVRGAALLVPALAGGAACGSSRADTARRRSGDVLRRRVHALVSAALPKGASATVLAARGSDPVYGEGFGLADRARGIRCGRGTVYDIASNTKQFTAAAVLSLESEGLLHVRDRLGDLLPGLPADKRPLTVHQLLTHTSGLPEFLPERYGDDFAPLSRARMLRALSDTSLRSRPGREFHYSNLGYSLLAAVIEERSGLPYEECLAGRLFRPAGMSQTGCVRPRWRETDVAVEYDDAGAPAGRPHRRPWAPDGPYWNLRGNGGILSTATDLFLLARGPHGGRGPHRRRPPQAVHAARVRGRRRRDRVRIRLGARARRGRARRRLAHRAEPGRRLLLGDRPGTGRPGPRRREHQLQHQERGMGDRRPRPGA
ncbi:serine hydrolase domain-containing protein [Streptomyces sp. PmtG]